MRQRLVLAGEVGEANGDRPQILAPDQVDQWTQEVVPGKEEVEQTHRGDRGPGLRHDDRDQGAKGPGAIDHGRLVHIARDAHEELAQQKHVVGIAEEVRYQQR